MRLSGVPMSTPATVGVIGGGASGTLAAVHLARRAAQTGTALDIVLVDPGDPGIGLAYSTVDPRHRLNVPACGMSAWDDDPGHFLRWLRRHVAVDFPERGFAPRMHYAQYLASVLDHATRLGPQIRIEHVRARVTDLAPVGRRLRLSLDDGTRRPGRRGRPRGRARRGVHLVGPARARALAAVRRRPLARRRRRRDWSPATRSCSSAPG